MQNIIRKFAIFSFFLILVGSTYAEKPTEKLLQADSLFLVKRYTQAYEIYNTLWEEDQAYTPAMLMRMAYIKEGLSEPAKALYFLQKYYDETLDEATLSKMNEIAEPLNLNGYALTDERKAKTFVIEYAVYVKLVIAGLLTLVCFALWIEKKRHDVLGVPYLVMILLLAGGLYYLNNFALTKNQGILSKDATYLMAEPSAGAKLITIANQGHKVDILEKKDAWVKISWDGESVFVRENRIIEL